MSDYGLPPNVGAHDRVVLFDGVCRLCSAWARFLLRYDRKQVFKLATVQSPEGAAILVWLGMPTDHFETIVVVEGPHHYVRSEAFLRVMRALGLPFSLLAATRILPRPIRDWLYDRIALNRYRLFGRYDACVLPRPEDAARFLRG